MACPGKEMHDLYEQNSHLRHLQTTDFNTGSDHELANLTVLYYKRGTFPSQVCLLGFDVNESVIFAQRQYGSTAVRLQSSPPTRKKRENLCAKKVRDFRCIYVHALSSMGHQTHQPCLRANPTLDPEHPRSLFSSDPASMLTRLLPKILGTEVAFTRSLELRFHPLSRLLLEDFGRLCDSCFSNRILKREKKKHRSAPRLPIHGCVCAIGLARAILLKAGRVVSCRVGPDC